MTALKCLITTSTCREIRYALLKDNTSGHSGARQAASNELGALPAAKSDYFHGRRGVSGSLQGQALG
ncbi:MAG: hypothetical protein ACTXOO_03550 [Sodalis sp. (in: enterobacteria)]